MFNFKKFWGNDIIEFYCHPSLKDVIPEPRPARKDLPSWFKTLSPTCNENNDDRDSFGNLVMSAKKCLPLLDGMSLGFTIPLGGDVRVRSNHDNSQINITNPPGNVVFCEFHKSAQVGGPNAIKPKHGDPLKFINHWIIKTAPGWSTLFVPPLNNFEQPFTCLSALVDTDVYPKEVNFPAVLNIRDVDERIPAGTPLVTAIPIRRDVFDLKKAPIKDMSDEEFKKIGKMSLIQNTRTHYYTHELRIKK
jgi:hypothetical protein